MWHVFQITCQACHGPEDPMVKILTIFILFCVTKIWLANNLRLCCKKYTGMDAKVWCVLFYNIKYVVEDRMFKILTILCRGSHNIVFITIVQRILWSKSSPLQIQRPGGLWHSWLSFLSQIMSQILCKCKIYKLIFFQNSL